MLQLTIFTGPPLSGKTYQAQRALKAAADHCEPIFIEGINSMDGFEMLVFMMCNNSIDMSPAEPLALHSFVDVHFFVTTRLPVEIFKPLFEEIPHVNIIHCNYQPPKKQAL